MSIIEFPLTKSNRFRLVQAFRNVPRLEMSIEPVIEGQMLGADVGVFTR